MVSLLYSFKKTNFFCSLYGFIVLCNEPTFATDVSFLQFINELSKEAKALERSITQTENADNEVESSIESNSCKYLSYQFY